MQARGRTVGLLSIFNGPEARPFDDSEIALARDVAARAALALDNARLYSQQRELAEELQRSLLTPPPEPDHVEVVVRYAAAARAAQVGGDWYDAFLQPDGATVLVIGDVVGHDTAAAAAMGQVRGLLRGIAFTTEQGPADVLSRLDAAIEGLQVGTTATAVVARPRADAEERDAASPTCAGPTPATRRRWRSLPTGEVLVSQASRRPAARHRPAEPRVESRVTLERGSTVLLYTDGLVERRGQSLDVGLERLRDGARSSWPTSRCPSCATRCSSGCSRRPRDDDVAMVGRRSTARTGHADRGPGRPRPPGGAGDPASDRR
jgi:hypothetical protein